MKRLAALLRNAADRLDERPSCACGAYPEAAAEAWKDLAEIAYGSRDAVWTSHRTLVRAALEVYGRRAAV